MTYVSLFVDLMEPFSCHDFREVTGTYDPWLSTPAVPDAQRSVIRAGDANHLLEVLAVLFLFYGGFLVV